MRIVIIPLDYQERSLLLDKKDQFIQQHFNSFKTDLSELISLKGISATNDGIQDTVAFLTNKLKTLLGADVQIIRTAGSPTILATISGASNRTILFYGHYDVMTPGVLSLWHTPPFQLTEKDGRLYGRGIGDNKGQLLAQIFVLYTYKDLHGKFPFNIKLLIEGEEEQGSKNLPTTINKLKTTELADVDYAIVVDGSFNQSGDHVLRLGNRGALGFEIKVKTARQDNHSGNLGNIMKNPVLILMSMINRLIDLKTGQVTITDFYTGVHSPSATEITWIKQLPYDPVAITAQTGVDSLPSSGLDFYKRIMFRPTFNVSGINAGYSDHGMKTIIPHEATIKLDCRLVGEQDPSKIKQAINRILKPELDSRLASINYLVEVPPSKTNADQSLIPKIISAIKSATGSGLIEPVMPGTVPNYVWTKILRVPTFTIPYANFDQHNHAPNENMTVKAFLDGIRISYELATKLI